jgi:hypothetical protein
LTAGTRIERAGGFYCENTYQARRVDLTAQSHGRGRIKNKEWVILLRRSERHPNGLRRPSAASATLTGHRQYPGQSGWCDAAGDAKTRERGG